MFDLCFFLLIFSGSAHYYSLGRRNPYSERTGAGRDLNEYGAVAISTRRPAPNERSPQLRGFATYFNSGASVHSDNERDSSNNATVMECTPLSRANHRLASAAELESQAQRKSTSI